MVNIYTIAASITILISYEKLLSILINAIILYILVQLLKREKKGTGKLLISVRSHRAKQLNNVVI